MLNVYSGDSWQRCQYLRLIPLGWFQAFKNQIYLLIGYIVPRSWYHVYMSNKLLVYGLKVVIILNISFIQIKMSCSWFQVGVRLKFECFVRKIWFNWLVTMVTILLSACFHGNMFYSDYLSGTWVRLYPSRKYIVYVKYFLAPWKNC